MAIVLSLPRTRTAARTAMMLPMVSMVVLATKLAGSAFASLAMSAPTVKIVQRASSMCGPRRAGAASSQSTIAAVGVIQTIMAAVGTVQAVMAAPTGTRQRLTTMALPQAVLTIATGSALVTSGGALQSTLINVHDPHVYGKNLQHCMDTTVLAILQALLWHRCYCVCPSRRVRQCNAWLYARGRIGLQGQIVQEALIAPLPRGGKVEQHQHMCACGAGATALLRTLAMHASTRAISCPTTGPVSSACAAPAASSPQTAPAAP
jgi:hypothetical protein